MNYVSSIYQGMVNNWNEWSQNSTISQNDYKHTQDAIKFAHLYSMFVLQYDDWQLVLSGLSGSDAGTEGALRAELERIFNTIQTLINNMQQRTSSHIQKYWMAEVRWMESKIQKGCINFTPTKNNKGN